MKQNALKYNYYIGQKINNWLVVSLDNGINKAVVKCTKCNNNYIRCLCVLKLLNVKGCRNCKNYCQKKTYPIKTSEYNTWVELKQRCLNPNHKNYKDYGGRGITVCKRWLNPNTGYPNFLRDMGKRPEGVTRNGRSVYSIERINNNGDYKPSNCKWATQSEQVNNRRPIMQINSR